MPGDESKAFAQFEQEILQLFDQSLFDLAFLKPAGTGQAKEFQHNRIADEVPRAGLHLLNIGGCFLNDGAAIAARQKTFVVQGIDLVLQRSA
ncbi:hypothetical protein D3C73_1182560 [compost metagenome]